MSCGKIIVAEKDTKKTYFGTSKQICCLCDTRETIIGTTPDKNKVRIDEATGKNYAKMLIPES